MAIPLSLYIHFPWCVGKCPYCDFNSSILTASKKELLPAYVAKLLVDLEIEAADLPHNRLHSIYFGGGTPSLLPIAAMAKIIRRIKQLFILQPNIEVTLEANPDTIDLEACLALRDLGINRISLGVQSFVKEELCKLGRSYDVKQVQVAIDRIKQAGFSNFNLDLMFGLPQQSVASALYSLAMALDFKPPHLSWYQLTIETNTVFAQQPPVLPGKEELWQIQQEGQNLLTQFLPQYEVSAYGKPEFVCQHNINYWQYGDYLGIGAGAHSKITAKHVVKRFQKAATPEEYLRADLTVVKKIVPEHERAFEFMLNALRLYSPVSYALFCERTGVTIATIAKELQIAENLGLLKLHSDVLVTTIKGKNFLNDLLEIFLNV